MKKGQYKHSEETRKKLSLSHMGHKHSAEQKRKISEGVKKSPNTFKKGHVGYGRGIPRSKEVREKMSLSKKGKPHLNQRGKFHYNWKGGINPINDTIRKSLEYKLWRTAVFERDAYTCVWCGDKTSGNLNADHIKRFSDYPELRFAIDNGRTLCVPCHRTTDTYGCRNV